ncbi:hypothetical protein [Pontivivens nitratireducens]|uniref:Uncharacterized protein n=1 Tax=Pontivivens nitratireducens TaxID=2758038 RepID=A0A6G7VLC9_9RHOB|nr:hypothetical protein [Pontibrevibacter nitratireducens]QIK40710.1 hypothetical protein G8E03_07980 [Pontibrevibacter nitratireducens]
MLSAAEEAGLLTALAAIIAAISGAAIRQGGKERDPQRSTEDERLRHDLERAIAGLHRKLTVIDDQVERLGDLMVRIATTLDLIIRKLGS